MEAMADQLKRLALADMAPAPAAGLSSSHSINLACLYTSLASDVVRSTYPAARPPARPPAGLLPRATARLHPTKARTRRLAFPNASAHADAEKEAGRGVLIDRSVCPVDSAGAGNKSGGAREGDQGAGDV